MMFLQVPNFTHLPCYSQVCRKEQVKNKKSQNGVSISARRLSVKDEIESAFKVFDKMTHTGSQPGAFTGGLVDQALVLFSEMLTDLNFVPDVVAHNSLIKGVFNSVIFWYGLEFTLSDSSCISFGANMTLLEELPYQMSSGCAQAKDADALYSVVIAAAVTRNLRIYVRPCTVKDAQLCLVSSDAASAKVSVSLEVSPWTAELPLDKLWLRL
ncbi:hypothetical protein C5167_007288 [Papaver somniferum]|nr:hypothetical protein C5167_007288 [Papaver somniferum]